MLHLVMCRHKFAQASYLRLGKNGSPKGVEHTVIYLIQAASVAVTDKAALDSIAEAHTAQARQAAAAQELAEASHYAEAAQQVQLLAH